MLSVRASNFTPETVPSAGAAVAYLLFLLANVALFVRPAELVPALGNVQVYFPLIFAAAAANLSGLNAQLSRGMLVRQPVHVCVLTLIVAVPLSHLTATMHLSAAWQGAVQMLKFAVYYLMLTSVIHSPARLRRLMLVIAVCATVLVGVCIVDFARFQQRWSNVDEVLAQLAEDRLVPYDQRVLFHAVEIHGTDELGDVTVRYRMRGLGIFSDPNDVALLITVAGTIAFYFLTDRSLGAVRWLWWIPLAILAYGYVQTQSRGGLLAIAAAGTVWLAVRYGGTVAVGLGVLGLLAAPVALGRAGDLDISSGSGQERIQLWSDGLVALKSVGFMFGIGQGQIVDLTGLVAHNSYIHAFVELGLLGGTAFLGCFFFPAWGLYRLRRDLTHLVHPELRRMLPFVAAILAAWCVGMLSLSLCYSPATYMAAGLGAAYVHQAGVYRPSPRPVVPLNWLTTQRLAVCSLGLLAASFVFVKVFARFGA